MTRAKALLTMISVTLLTITTMLITGCLASQSTSQSVSQSASQSVSQSASQSTSQSASQSASQSEEPKVSIDYASPELLNDKGSYDYYSEDDFSAEIVLTTNFDAENLRFIAVAYTETGGSFKLTEEKELFSYGTLTPKKPLVIGTNFFGVIPDRGISFKDTNGVERYYVLTMSGDDGSILLIAFEDFS